MPRKAVPDGPPELICEGCKRPFVATNKRGPCPSYCSGPCKQAAYRRRTDSSVGSPEAAARRSEAIEALRDLQSVRAGLRQAGLTADQSAPVASRGQRGWINGQGADLDALSAPQSWWPTCPEEVVPLGSDSDRPGVGQSWRWAARAYLDGRFRVPSESFGAIDRKIAPPPGATLSGYLENLLYANPLDTQAASAALPHSMRFVHGDNLSASWHLDGTPVGARPEQKIDTAIRRLFLEEEVYGPLVDSKKEDNHMSVITDAELHERLTAVEESLQQALRDLVVTAGLLSQRLPAERRQAFAECVVPILSTRMRAAS